MAEISMTRDGRAWMIGILFVAVLSCYLIAYAVYATLNRVPDERLSESFLRHHRGAILFRDSVGGTIAWYAFCLASFTAYWLLNIDAEWHQGDSFGHWFCEDDYIDR